MQAKFVIILCVLLATGVTSALEFQEKIEVNGGGEMATSTHTLGAEDNAKGAGQQDYERYIKTDYFYDANSFTSNYHIAANARYVKNYMGTFKTKIAPEEMMPGGDEWKTYPLEFFPNRYSIEMKSPNFLQHSLSVNEIENFSSENAISFDKGKVQTKFDVSGSGKLVESVKNLGKDSNPKSIADTWIDDSNFVLKSGLSEQLPFSLDLDVLLDKLNKTQMGSENKSRDYAMLSPRELSKRKPGGNDNGERGNGSKQPIGGREKQDASPTASGEGSEGGQPGDETSGQYDAQENLEEKITTKSVDDYSDPFPGNENDAEPENISPSGLGYQGVQMENPDILWPSTSEFFIAPRENMLPMIYLGKMARIDYLWELSMRNKAIPREGYDVTYEGGKAIAVSTECDGELCVNSTFISAANRVGEPTGWMSPYAQADLLSAPPQL